MIEFVRVEKEDKECGLIPMNNLENGQVALVVGNSEYVIMHNRRGLVLGAKKNHYDDISYREECVLQVRVLSPGENVIVSFSNSK